MISTGFLTRILTMRRGIVSLAVGILLVAPLGAWLGEETPPPSPWLGAQVGEIGEMQGGPLAYDPATNELWVGTSVMYPAVDLNVSVVNLTTGRVVAQIPYDPPPREMNEYAATVGIVFDPSNGNSYVGADDGNVTVINVSSHTVVKTVVTGCCATSIAYDAENREIFIIGAWGDQQGSEGNTTIISTISNAIVGRVPVGGVGIAADPLNGVLAVTQGSNLSFMNPTTYELTARTPLPHIGGGFSDPFVYDPFTNAWYGPTGGTSGPTLTMINATSHMVEKTVAIPYPASNIVGGLALDPANGFVYITCQGQNGGELESVNALTDTFVGTVDLPPMQLPGSIVYDGTDLDLYVSGPFAEAVTVFSPSAPQPGPTFPNLDSPNTGWAEFGILLGATFVLVGIRRYRQDRKVNHMNRRKESAVVEDKEQ